MKEIGKGMIRELLIAALIILIGFITKCDEFVFVSLWIYLIVYLAVEIVYSLVKMGNCGVVKRLLGGVILLVFGIVCLVSTIFIVLENNFVHLSIQ